MSDCRQAKFGKAIGEAEAVQQAESEGHNPRIAAGQALLPAPGPRDLDGQEEDRQRNQRLDEPRRDLEESERRRSQRDAVRDGEGGDGRREPPPAADQQHKAKHEKQVVDAEHDVLDAEPKIAPRDFDLALRGLDHEGRRRGGEPDGLRGAVLPLQAHEHVRADRLEAVHRDRPSREAARRFDLPTLDVGIAEQRADPLASRRSPPESAGRAPA